MCVESSRIACLRAFSLSRLWLFYRLPIFTNTSVGKFCKNRKSMSGSKVFRVKVKCVRVFVLRAFHGMANFKHDSLVTLMFGTQLSKVWGNASASATASALLLPPLPLQLACEESKFFL